MRRGIELALLLGAAIAATVALAAEPGDAKLKPGARGKLCLSCHVDFETTLHQPFVHTPVKDGNCADCHSPHASRHGKLLTDEPNAICATCHAGLVPDGARSVHKVVAEGRCTGCHDPHASPNRGHLVSGGNALCESCHAEVAKAATEAKFKHPPVGKSCLTCHDPHASAGADALLKTAVPALCLGCHKPDAPSFAKQHQGYPVQRGDCTSCHDPHGSSVGGLLWANVHPPMANGMCGQCHGDPASAQALEPKRGGLDLCRGCHDDLVDGIFAGTHAHGPVVDRRACLNCHEPHAARESALLSAPQKQLCGACHADTLARQARSLVKHDPAEQGLCSTCHAPHGSSNSHLLANGDVNALCGTCHDWQHHSSHPIGPTAIDPRNKSLTLDCTSCHAAHGSEYKAFLHLDPKHDLCVQCHERFRR